jgi:hypothetical protein
VNLRQGGVAESRPSAVATTRNWPEFERFFADKGACRAYLERLRWPDGFARGPPGRALGAAAQACDGPRLLETAWAHLHELRRAIAGRVRLSSVEPLTTDGLEAFAREAAASGRPFAPTAGTPPRACPPSATGVKDASLASSDVKSGSLIGKDVTLAATGSRSVLVARRAGRIASGRPDSTPPVAVGLRSVADVAGKATAAPASQARSN